MVDIVVYYEQVLDGVVVWQLVGQIEYYVGGISDVVGQQQLEVQWVDGVQ